MQTPKRPKMMVRYKNLSGDSKVVRYELRKDALQVRFADNSEYIYNNQTNGPETIAKMKTLAESGKGLGTFITKTIKENFARKVR